METIIIDNNHIIMKQLYDYSSMFAVLEKFTKPQIEEKLKEYNKQKKEVAIKISSAESYYDMLSRNANYFEKRIKEIEYFELEKNFTLKPEHKIILQNIKIGVKDTSGLRYLYDNYIEVIFKKDEYELSEKEQDDLLSELDKLVSEIPFAIKELAV